MFINTTWDPREHFPGGSDGNESACNAEDLGLIRELRSLGGEAWQPTPVFLPGKSPWTEEPGGLQSMNGVTENQKCVFCILQKIKRMYTKINLGSSRFNTVKDVSLKDFTAFNVYNVYCGFMRLGI